MSQNIMEVVVDKETGRIVSVAMVVASLDALSSRSLPAITHKISETNSSFYVKLHTTGKA